ncbi:hypothetical protein H257_12000 [Aphanomyces astaci]|uniref:Uncharacterized protein n=1 Tax=Aphanomyces astaci TaxID=112090 RepID=W4G1P1_APHAT|nr:hypothetical protein H257_12000 [Aphanomyces astaci]ETV73191.1 hypothetical protein H257_12000 [Aphanomyces astaci]|eukprot:XP_009837396.1 hypothetical protein H257_12000 [Aphanomyces astaci]
MPAAYVDEGCSNAHHDVTIDDFDGTKPLTSPRSIEACYAVGITPDELMPRTVASFASPKEDLSFTMKRAERFEQRRVTLLDQVRVARQRQHLDQSAASSVVDYHLPTRPRSSPTKGRRSPPRSPSGKPTTATGNDIDSTVVETERRRLEKIQARQLAEMHQMINWEIKQAELSAKQADEMAERKRQEDAAERDKARRLREAEAARRQRELDKRQKQWDEVAAARTAALADYAEAKQRKELDDQAKLAWKAELVQRERDRVQKADEHKQQTQSILHELEAQALKRMDDMARRDKARKDKLDRRRHEKMIEMMERTQRNKQRIVHVLHDKDRLSQMRRDAYMQRQADSEARRLRLEAELAVRRQDQARVDAERKEAEIAIREHHKQLETDRRERLLEAERDAELRLQIRTQQKDAQRQRRLEDEHAKNMERARVAQRMRDSEVNRQSQILSKSQSKGQRAEMVQHKRKMEMRAKWEEAKLREEAIQDALQRKARRDDYHKSLLLSKLDGDQARTDAIKWQKELILQQRRRVKQQADIQRQDILNSFYKMKITKKFNLQAVESILSTTSQKSISGGSPLANPLTSHRPKTAPKGARRPTTPHKCSRVISRRISRYPSDKDMAQSTSNESPAQEPDVMHKQPTTTTLDEQVAIYRRRQNQQLLHVLEEEQAAEEQRDVILRRATDTNERSRLEKIFGFERAQASDRIIRLTEEHEIMFHQHMTELGQAASM